MILEDEIGWRIYAYTCMHILGRSDHFIDCFLDENLFIRGLWISCHAARRERLTVNSNRRDFARGEKHVSASLKELMPVR